MPLIAEASPQVLDRLARLLQCANQNAALVIEALCSQSAVLAEGVHQARPNTGQVEVAEEIRRLLARSQIAQLDPEQLPRFVVDRSAPHALGAALDLDSRASWHRGAQPAPPDRYSVHCTPQIHGALLEQLRRVRQPVDHAVVECADVSGSAPGDDSRPALPPFGRLLMPGLCGTANLKAAIAALASISERRLAKLLDPAQNHGLPASLVPNPDGNHYGLMVLRYRAATLVSELSDRATPTGSLSALSPKASDSDPAGETGETTRIDVLCESLRDVLALERFAAVQALRVRIALLARVHGAAFAPAPGEFAVRVIEQFESAGLRTIWDGRKLRDEIERVRGMMGE